MPVNEEVRKESIAKALDGLGAEHETLRVRWRGKMERLPVIRIGLDLTVLNPKSHRIKSQLESEPSAKELIEEDPEGEGAQAAVAALLRATQGFDDLKQNLDDDSQREPGIVTRQGRLINANTRAVALRDLGEEYVEVAVLPVDATLGEIYDLELDLQVAEDYRQDYSFTNELLFVDDLITGQGRDEEEVALRLRWATPTKPSSMKKGTEQVCRYVRHLALIREIQEMSGGKIPLTDFDDSEQALQEFDKAYEALRGKDPGGAERLKMARTLGLLVDLGYSRQRQVDGGWVEDYLAEAFSEDNLLSEVSEAVAGAPAGGDGAAGTDGLEVFEQPLENSDGAPTVHEVVKLLAVRLSESARAETVTLPMAKGEAEFSREEVRDSIGRAMEAAAEDAKRATNAGNELGRPAHFTAEAARRMTKARQTYEKVHGRPGFDMGSLHAEVEKAERALDALKQSIDG
jgi:hypothetical protein